MVPAMDEDMRLLWMAMQRKGKHVNVYSVMCMCVLLLYIAMVLSIFDDEREN